MSRRADLGLALLLAVVAPLLFFAKSAATPPGFREDTMSVALNAYCVLETGADEYGEPWPVVGFRSLDDYKGTLNLYGLAAVFAAFGPGLVATRLASMAATYFGTLCLALVLHRAREIEGPRLVSLDAVFFSLLLLSPWLLVPERAWVECGVVYGVAAAAVASGTLVLRKPGSLWPGVVQGVATGLLAYCYSPGKVMFVALPFALVVALAAEPPRGFRKLLGMRGLVAALLCALLLGLPHLLDAVGPGRGLTRFRSVGGGFSPARVVHGLADNLSPGFLFLRGDADATHHFGFGGMLNPFFLPAVLAGLVVVARQARTLALARFALLMLLLGALPAAIAEQTPPHALRALLVVPPLAIVGYWGWAAAQAWSRGRAPVVAVLLVWTALGAAHAAAGLRVFFGSYSARNLGGLPEARPRWNTEREKPPYDDHGLDSLPERYYRTVRGDLGYCGQQRR